MKYLILFTCFLMVPFVNAATISSTYGVVSLRPSDIAAKAMVCTGLVIGERSILTHSLCADAKKFVVFGDNAVGSPDVLPHTSIVAVKKIDLEIDSIESNLYDFVVVTTKDSVPSGYKIWTNDELKSALQYDPLPENTKIFALTYLSFNLDKSEYSRGQIQVIGYKEALWGGTEQILDGSSIEGIVLAFHYPYLRLNNIKYRAGVSSPVFASRDNKIIPLGFSVGFTGDSGEFTDGGPQMSILAEAL